MWWIAEAEKLAYWSGGNIRPTIPDGFQEVQVQDDQLSWIPAAPPLPLPGKSLITQWNEDEVPAEARARAELDPLSKPIWTKSAAWGRYGDSFIGLIDLTSWKVYIRPVFYIVHKTENRMSEAVGFRTKASSILMDMSEVRNHYGPQNIVEVEWLDVNNQGTSHNTAVSKCGLYIDNVLGFGLTRGAGEQETAELLVASGRNFLTWGTTGPTGASLSGWARRGTSAERYQAAMDFAEAMRLRRENASPSDIKDQLPFQFRKKRNRRFLPPAWKSWLFEFLRVHLPLEGSWRLDDR